MKFRRVDLFGMLLCVAAFFGVGPNLASVPAQLAPPTSRPTYARPARIIGWWQCDVAHMPAAKASGVNTLISMDQAVYRAGGGVTPAQWMAAASAQGLWYIREPLSTDTASACQADPNLIAFLHGGPLEPGASEPEAQTNSAGASAPTPASVLGEVYTARAAWDIPFATVFSGGHVLGFQSPSGAIYAPYLPYTDILIGDIYVVAGWGIGLECGINGHVSIGAPAECDDLLAKLKPGAERIIVIDGCQQFSGVSWLPGGGRGPTTTEMWAEAGPLIPRQGVAWFTCLMSPGFAYDNRTPAQSQTMTAINKVLAR